MKIAIDVSPLTGSHSSAHRVRGTGFYIQNLISSLRKYYPQNEYVEFSKENELPEDVDIVHYPYFEPFFLTLPKKNRYKTVVTVHDLTPLVFPNNFPSGIRGKIRWLVQKKRLSKANAIITDSESSKRDIEKYVSTKIPIGVVYLAADGFTKKKISGSQKKTILEKYSLPDEFLLYVGDATWNKNLPRIVSAVLETSVTLVMVGKALAEKNVDSGNPWNKDIVAVQEKAEQAKNIHLLGFVSNEDLELLYNLATVFVMPSLYEGFGLPLLEAMSCGAACISSKEGSLPEVGGDAPLYVDAHNAESIKNGIEKLIENKKLRGEMQKKGVIQAKKFSWEKTAKETVRIYEKVYS